MNRTITRSLALVAHRRAGRRRLRRRRRRRQRRHDGRHHGRHDRRHHGRDDGGATTGGTGGTAGPVDLSACPDPLVVQTDWFPEAEHGSLYEMVGEGYTVDTEKKVVARPARRRRRGDRHRHRGPHRRPGHRLPAGVRPAVRRRQHHARLRQHRGPDPALGRDAGAVGRRPAGDQPADHLLGPGDLPRRRRRWPTSARRT